MMVLALIAVFGTVHAIQGGDEAKATAAADFHVAPNGNDANQGSFDKPFATVAKARNAIREKIAAGLTKDLTVLIRGGVYTQTDALVFGPEDSATEEHSITYAAYPGEKVVLSGGRNIHGWKKGDGEIWTTEIPEVKAGQWCFRQLFVNGQRAVRARTPNVDDKTPWWTIRTSTIKPHPNNDNATPVVLSVDHPIKALTNDADLEFIYLNNNDASRKRVGEINEKDQTFTLCPPHQWPSTAMPGEFQICFPQPGHTGYFENAREFLDQPGEWHLDRRTGVLSYWPRPGEDLTKAGVTAAVAQNTLLAVAGTAEKPVRNLHFDGIHIEYVDWPLPAFGFAAQFGCLQLTSDAQFKVYWIDAAVQLEHARLCSFTNGGIAHAGGMGLVLLQGTAQDTIEGNQLYDLGGGGIGGGCVRDRATLTWTPAPKEGEYRGIRVANNHIHHCGADYFGSVGICFAMLQESTIEHNLIHDLPYSGIVMTGNQDPKAPFAKNNTIQYNHIYGVQKVAVDGSGIYVSVLQASPGSVIRGNLIHDIRSNPFNPRKPWLSPGLYLDGCWPEVGCKIFQIEDNVTYNTDTPVFLCHGKREDNVWLNNTLVENNAPPPPAEVLDAMQAKAGLEPVYRQKMTQP
jgi:hypothetical protein